jgi:hypothetical protein
MCHYASWELPCGARSVADGRRLLRQALLGWQLAEGDPAWAVLDTALVVVSELLANAAVVCAGPFQLAIEAHHDRVHVEVRDDSPALAQVRPPDDEGGRGLHLVETLAEVWGQSPFDGTAKSVWAEMAVNPGSVLGYGCRELPPPFPDLRGSLR